MLFNKIFHQCNWPKMPQLCINIRRIFYVAIECASGNGVVPKECQVPCNADRGGRMPDKLLEARCLQKHIRRRGNAI